ncbi:MAG TPA: peroxidase-related enzyme [Hyphomicrobiaceae bacterium]|nr:peroxidase-related enzyme [Hyphomicrobiaceae bacterium]
MQQRAKEAVIALDLGPEAALSPELKAYFAKCEQKLGFVPNVLRAYAFDEVKLKAFIDMVDDLMLGDSGLSKLEREMIAVAVSAVNHCHYCLAAHGAAVRQRAKNPEMGELMAQNYRAAHLPVRQKKMLDFAVKLTEHPDKVQEADRAILRQAGFSDREIWDIAAVTGFFNMSNRIAAAADMRPNREYHYIEREKAD